MNGTVGTLTIEMAANIVRLQQDMDKAKKTVDSAMGSVEKSIDRVTTAIGAIASAFSVQAFTTKIIQVQREFDILNASLITVTGSSRNAEIDFAWIKNFATTTPFSLAEVTGAFIKMKSLGLDASAEALKSYGNTASAMGKSLNDLIEAVADAATGEFERLKEFGIKANAEGDRVTLTFRGVSTNIGKNAAEITEYLRSIGEVDFAGAMENRANTLDGAISNLSDTWDELFRTINKGLFGDLLINSVQGLTSFFSSLNNGIETLGNAIDANQTKLLIWAGIFTTGALVAALPLITAAVGALTAGVIALSAAFAANPVALAIMAVTAAAIPAVNAISSMVTQSNKAETATKGLHQSEIERANFLDANASPAVERSIGKTKEQIQEIKNQETAYTNLIGKLREQNLELLAEESNNGKLTETQRTAHGVMVQIQNGTLNLTNARKFEIVEILEANIQLQNEKIRRDEVKKSIEEQEKAYEKIKTTINSSIGKIREEQGELATLTSGQKTAMNVLSEYQTEIGNMTEERKLEIAEMLNQLIEEANLKTARDNAEAALSKYNKEKQNQFTELEKTTTALQAELTAQKNSNLEIGLSTTEIGNLEAAKLSERIESLKRQAQIALESGEDAKISLEYERQIELLQELKGEKDKAVHLKMAKESADEWKKTTDELSKGLTDALMRGFESGKGFFENLIGVLKNRFMSFVAESIIKPFMDGIAGGLTALTAPITLAVRSVVNSLMTSIGLGGAVGGGAGGVVAGGAAGVAAGGAVAAGAAGGAGAAGVAAGGGILSTIGGGIASAGSAIASGVGAVASSIGSGISAAASALGPAGLLLAGGAVLAGALDGGETRRGGRYIWDQSGARFLAGPSGGQIGYTNQMQDELNKLAQELNSSGNSIKPGLKVYELYAGIESSKNGKGGTFLGGRWNDGTRFGDIVPGDNPGAWQFNQSIHPDDALDQFRKEIEFAGLDALAKIPGSPYSSSNRVNPGGSSGAGGGGLGLDNGLTPLATGTNLIPKDMIAMLHEGEAVVPRQYNPAIGGENVVAAEIKSLRDEVTLMRAETRSTAINTSKMARLQDNWDVRGLTVKTDADQPLDTVVV